MQRSGFTPLILCVVIATCATGTAWTQVRQDPSARVVTAILISSSAYKALQDRANATERSAFQRELALEQRLSRAIREKNISEAARREAIAQLERVQAGIVAQGERLAQRDPSVRELIGRLQESLQLLANTQDPAVIAALQHYADDNRGAAEELQAAVRARRGKLTGDAQAREQRAVATVWSDAIDKSMITSNAALNAWREADQLDPKQAIVAMTIARLHSDLGNLPAADEAARRALNLAKTPRERASSQFWLGTIAHAQGRRADAIQYYSSALGSYRKIMLSDPKTDNKRNIAGALSELGRLQIENGDLTAAAGSFDEALAICQALYAADPTDLLIKQNLSNALQDRGYLATKQRDFRFAMKLYQQSLAQARAIVSSRSTASAKASLGVALSRLGETAEALRDLDAANAAYTESLALDQALLRDDPGNDERLAAVGVSYSKMGRIAKAQGRTAAAVAALAADVEVSDRRVASNPSSALAMRSAVVAHASLAQMRGYETHWSNAFAIITRMDRMGLLATEDRWMLASIGQKLGRR